MLRHISRKRGVRRDRRSKMTVADAGATWKVYAALGRLYRRDPEMAKALFPGIHGFVAESVAQGRHGWDEAASDAAARAACASGNFRIPSCGETAYRRMRPACVGAAAEPHTASRAARFMRPFRGHP